MNIIRDDSDLVRRTIIDHHYLHRYPDPRSLPFAYRLIVDNADYAPDNRPWGVVVFKKPQHTRQRGLFGYADLPTSWQVLDMARVWVHPQLQRKQGNHAGCAFSQMVSRAIRRVQWDWLEHHPPRFPDLPYHIRVIVSYCDLSHHDGTAYRASSFQWVGYTSDKTKEVYARTLKQPRKSWTPAMHGLPVQIPMFAGFPLKY